MKINTTLDKTVFRILVANLIILNLCSCSNQEAKILGDWSTDSNCTSKKGVNINYVGAQRFSKDEIVKDKGKMIIATKDSLGRSLGAEVDVKAESYWSISNNKITQRTVSTNYTARSLTLNGSPIYTNSATLISPRPQNSPESQALANSIEAELNKSSKEHSTNEVEIIQLDDEKLIVKNKSVEHSNNFDPGVCDTQTFTRGGSSGFDSFN
jgi:hypothetical protein